MAMSMIVRLRLGPKHLKTSKDMSRAVQVRSYTIFLTMAAVVQMLLTLPLPCSGANSKTYTSTKRKSYSKPDKDPIGHANSTANAPAHAGTNGDADRRTDVVPDGAAYGCSERTAYEHPNVVPYCCPQRYSDVSSHCCAVTAADISSHSSSNVAVAAQLSFSAVFLPKRSNL
jgi:hypothetical protein